MANFLTSRFEAGLEPSTVRNYKSAILAIHRGFRDGSTLGDNTSIKQLLNGMSNERPPARREVPPWSLNAVLDYLKGPPFEPMGDATLKNVTIKTATLVALASGRRCSEIHALSAATMRFSEANVSLSFRPDFVAKNETRTYQHSNLVLPRISANSSVAADRLWCPARALYYYKLKTASVRGATDNLFLTHAFPHNAASKSSIARWISSAIAGANAMEPSQVHAHSTRHVASSWAYHRGLSISEICEAVNWRAPTTFSSVYYRNVQSTQEKFAGAVLRK